MSQIAENDLVSTKKRVIEVDNQNGKSIKFKGTVSRVVSKICVATEQNCKAEDLLFKVMVIKQSQ